VNLWEAIGWTGNAAFFSRFLVQWWASERARRSVVPVSFWWLSLIGTLTLGVYTFERGEPILLFSFAINGAIYLRNLWLMVGHRSKRRMHPALATGFGASIAIALLTSGDFRLRDGFDDTLFWNVVGTVGTAIWSLRFLVQWWASERAGHSVFTRGFWILSLIGNVLLLAYALHLGNPIYILGFVPGPIVQVRNLVLERRARRVMLHPVRAPEHRARAPRAVDPAPRLEATARPEPDPRHAHP